MTPVSDNHNEHRPPTGNLEDLFRQQLGEAELTPRADVWDRLDHELLLRENQGYRRRLVNYRWATAAAAAVATLGLGGWLTQSLTSTAPNGQAVAVVGTDAGARAAAARLGQAAREQSATRAAATAAATAPATAAAADQSAAPRPAAADRAVAYAAAATPLDGPAAQGRPSGTRRREAAAPGSPVRQALTSIRQTFGPANGSAAATGSQLATASQAANAGAAAVEAAPEVLRGNAGTMAATEVGTYAATTTPDAATAADAATAGAGHLAPAGSFANAAVATDAVAATDAAGATANGWALQPLQPRLLPVSLGALLPDSLKLALPNTSTLLAAQLPAADEDDNPARPASRWRWRGSYTAQRFMPNASSSPIAFADRALAGAGVVNAPRTAARPEPSQLDAGFVQRGLLGVSLPLGKKRWTLQTGTELALATGTAGRQVTQSYNAQTNQLDQKYQTGRYQLTTLAMPVQVRYESRRQGWGVYAAVGAAVNVLLRNRTELDGQVVINDSNYRRLLASGRGSAGVRYSPAGGSWQLNFGPEAEAGLSTLNANPTETWSQRTRPYALGLAASVEFGGGKPDISLR